jgi:Ca2+-binding RTX toxin-like protein
MRAASRIATVVALLSLGIVGAPVAAHADVYLTITNVLRPRPNTVFVGVAPNDSGVSIELHPANPDTGYVGPLVGGCEPDSAQLPPCGTDPVLGGIEFPVNDAVVTPGVYAVYAYQFPNGFGAANWYIPAAPPPNQGPPPPSQAPTIKTVSAQSEFTCGGLVTNITGTNLAAVTSVSVGSGAASFVEPPTATSLSVVVPPGPAGHTQLTVTSQYGSASVPFTYYAPLDEALGLNSGTLFLRNSVCSGVYAPNENLRVDEDANRVYVRELDPTAPKISFHLGSPFGLVTGQNAVSVPRSDVTSIDLGFNTPAGLTSNFDLEADIPISAVLRGPGSNVLTMNAPDASKTVSVINGSSYVAFGPTAPGNFSTFHGGSGNDVVAVGSGASVLDGGGGDNQVNYSSYKRDVTVRLPQPGQTVTVTNAEGTQNLSNFDEVVGGSGNDHLYGNDDPNYIDGGPGNDVLKGGPHNDSDRFEGGPGVNTVDYSDHAAPVTVHLADSGDSTGNGSVGENDIFLDASIQNIIGSSFNDHLTGNSGNNTIEGGGGGYDVMVGGGGVDTVDYHDQTLAVTVTLPEPGATSTNNGVYGHDSITGFSNIIGGSGNDTLTGNSGPNVIRGGPGADTIVGGGGVDTVDYSDHTAKVTVTLPNSGVSYGNGSAGENDTIDASIENVTGGSGYNTLIGNNADNVLDASASNYQAVLYGNGGNDTLLGGSAADVISGGPGFDHIYGGAGYDLIDAVDDTADVVSCGADGGAAHIDLKPAVYDTNVNFDCNVIGQDGWAGPYAPAGVGATHTAGIGVASLGTNQLSLVDTDTTGAIWYQSYNGSAWSAPMSLGGTTYGKPAIAKIGTYGLVVAVQGIDNNIYTKKWGCFGLVCAWQSTWTVVSAPPTGLALSAPAVVGQGTDGSLMLYVQGADRRLWGRGYDAPTNRWGSWFAASASVAMATGSAPAVANTTTVGLQDVYVRGVDNKLYEIASACPLGSCGFDANGFTALGGGGFTGSPTATTTGSGWAEVLISDASGFVHERAFVPGVGWYGWSTVTGPGYLVPAATSARFGTISLFTLLGGTNNVRDWYYQPTP